MRHEILKETITYLSEHTKFIRIATITTFIHSLLFTIYLLYLIVRYGAERFGEESPINALLTQYIRLISLDTGLLIILVVV